ncbi:hypothetical protein [Variovorax paradoxus]|uniref:hypothetical protein n=1 Tax=Variovorax paradoxus TaxID=34073 RepID=UPI001F5F363F|nr:hypothetical protein [Variovorax paradoxus]
MDLEQTIGKTGQSDIAQWSSRYWAPCLGVALVAISLFYVTLKDLVQESAARAPVLAPAVMPAHVEPATPAAGKRALPDELAGSSPEPVMPMSPYAPAYAPLAKANFEARAVAPVEPPAKAAPTVVEVHKCVMPEGGAAYSDGPCPEGAHATTLRLPRGLHASASL